MNTLRQNHKQRVEGCLLGVQIGDALGMPVETMKHDEIMILNNGHGVTGFMDPVQRKIPEMTKLKAGQTTDDWQLTQVVAESLIASGEWNRDDCAERHVNALQVSTFGWGKTTQHSVEDIRDRKRDLTIPPPIPEKPASGCGNGVIMKIAPLAIVAARNGLLKHRSSDESLEQLSKECMELAFITHPDPRAGYAAFAVAIVIHQIFFSGRKITAHDFDATLKLIISKVKRLEEKHRDFRYNPDTVSGRLERLCTVKNSGPTALRTTVGCGFTAMDTFAFTIGTFFRYTHNFKMGLLETVNAGGDTDTNASVVGAMIGANVGVVGIPKMWIDVVIEPRTHSIAKYLWPE